jgi:hypothetical protein
MLNHIPWPSIEGIPHLVKKAPHNGAGKITFRCKPKMHGTYAGIHIFRNEIQAQSRTQNIFPGDDNKGFAAWVAENLKAPIKEYDRPSPHVVIHGEWAGPGIIKGTSLTKLDQRYFLIFAMEVLAEEKDKDGNPAFHYYTMDPMIIDGWLPLSLCPANNPRVRILPFYPLEVTMDFEKMTGINEAAEAIAIELAKFDVNDPYVSAEFGVEGNGEGLVFYPAPDDVDGDFTNTPASMDYMFKCKTEKHKVAGSKELVPVSVEKVASARAFATKFVTEARIEQALSTNGIAEMTKPKLGPVIGWIVKDVMKESELELEASGLVWKDVSSAVAEEAKRQLLLLCVA